MTKVGALIPTDAEVAASIEAGWGWNRRRDLPDQVEWKDLRHSPELTASVVRDRVASSSLARCHVIPLPKPGSGFRPMTVVDPFDEIAFRIGVGRVCEAIDRSLTSSVKSYRLKDGPPGWRTTGSSYADRSRRREGLALIERPDFGGLGVFDVRNYYPSLSCETLARAMRLAGCNPTSAKRVLGIIGALNETWGVPGLAIGPEASGILGNVGLLSVDRRLLGAGLNFIRYTDDVHVLLPDRTSWFELSSSMEAWLAELGLELNRDGKLKHITSRGIARQLYVDPVLDELEALLEGDDARALQRTRYYFDAELERRRPDGRRLRFMLGVFRSRSDPYAVKQASSSTALLDLAPRRWGDYLADMHARGMLERDWLEEIATQSFQPQTAAVQYHLLRVAARAEPREEAGTRARDLALRGDVSEWTPLRCMAAEVWSRAAGWKPGAAAEEAQNAGDPHLRRALTLTLRHGSGRRLRVQLARLRSHLECRPAVAWVSSLI